MKEKFEEYFYYLRDNRRNPKVVVCLISDNGTFCRGISICSPKDLFNREQGTKKSRGRALAAMRREELTGAAIKRDESKGVLMSCIRSGKDFLETSTIIGTRIRLNEILSGKAFFDTSTIGYKSLRNVELTDREKQLLKIR